MRRTGIDLSLTRCIVVDAEMSRRFRKEGESKSLRVHNYAELAHTGSTEALTAELKVLVEQKAFPARAWVNLWPVASSHQYLLLPSASRSELEAAATRHAASALGLDSRDLVVGTSIGQSRGRPQHPSKMEVSYFAAAAHEIRTQLQPIVEAGFEVEGVSTPCGALWSQARLRRLSMPGDVHAFVALNATMSAIAIFANGFLLYARDLSWGYSETPVGPPIRMDRNELATRLAIELRRSFLYLKQYWEQDVSQLLLCGGMPEIRSLTAPLIDRLNIEVETLDTLEGIDASVLPEPSGRFSEHVAAFRLASAIAVEPPPVNLLPMDARATRVIPMVVPVSAAAAALAVAFAGFLYTRAGGDGDRVERQVRAVQRELPGPQSPMRAAVAQQAPAPRAPAPTAAAPRAGGVATAPETLRDRGRVAERPRPVKVLAETIGGPADPVVQSILFSASRQLALVDGRIVKPGDRVGALFVRSIEPDGVILTTRAGLRKRIGLDRPTIRIGRQ